MAELIGGEGAGGSRARRRSPTDTQRVDGFVDEIDETSPTSRSSASYAYSQPSEATTKVNAALLNNPDLAGVFAVEGNSGVGAVAGGARNADAIGDVALIGYDLLENQVEELEQGIYSALIAQDPAEEARIAIDFALAAIEGRDADIETEVVMPNVVMTADNLDETREYQYAEK